MKCCNCGQELDESEVAEANNPDRPYKDPVCAVCTAKWIEEDNYEQDREDEMYGIHRCRRCGRPIFNDYEGDWVCGNLGDCDFYEGGV